MQRGRRPSPSGSWGRRDRTTTGCSSCCSGKYLGSDGAGSSHSLSISRRRVPTSAAAAPHSQGRRRRPRGAHELGPYPSRHRRRPETRWAVGATRRRCRWRPPRRRAGKGPRIRTRWRRSRPPRTFRPRRSSRRSSTRARSNHLVRRTNSDRTTLERRLGQPCASPGGAEESRPRRSSTSRARSLELESAFAPGPRD